jgi:hypothetical protein
MLASSMLGGDNVFNGKMGFGSMKDCKIHDSKQCSTVNNLQMMPEYFSKT